MLQAATHVINSNIAVTHASNTKVECTGLPEATLQPLLKAAVLGCVQRGSTLDHTVQRKTTAQLLSVDNLPRFQVRAAAAPGRMSLGAIIVQLMLQGAARLGMPAGCAGVCTPSGATGRPGAVQPSWHNWPAHAPQPYDAASAAAVHLLWEMCQATTLNSQEWVWPDLLAQQCYISQPPWAPTAGLAAAAAAAHRRPSHARGPCPLC
jgi:hypothetical protein